MELSAAFVLLICNSPYCKKIKPCLNICMFKYMCVQVHAYSRLINVYLQNGNEIPLLIKINDSPYKFTKYTCWNVTVHIRIQLTMHIWNKNLKTSSKDLEQHILVLKGDIWILIYSWCKTIISINRMLILIYRYISILRNCYTSRCYRLQTILISDIKLLTHNIEHILFAPQ